MEIPQTEEPVADQLIKEIEGIIKQYTEGAVFAGEAIYAIVYKLNQCDGDTIEEQHQALRAKLGEA
jgi:hypothetical protein